MPKALNFSIDENAFLPVEQSFRAATDKTAVDTSKVPDGFLTKNLKKISERVRQPNAWELTKTDLFNGMEDAVLDNVSPEHPDYEKALEWAKNYDRMLSITGFPGSFIANWRLEKEVEKRGSKIGAKVPPSQGEHK
jgi:hypothetical protein